MAEVTPQISVGSRPIGVFDSGLGGLTVLKVLRQHFPNENFIYLGDTARIPYGSKSERTITKYFSHCAEFLESRGVKAIVVACNSASTVAKQIKTEIPIYDVIGPGAKTAASLTVNGSVGIIGTKATISKKAYVTEILANNPKLKVFQQACPLLVPLVEEGWDDDPITNLIVYRYLSPLTAVSVDTLVLGCTHYPVLKSAIQKVVGNAVELVDSGEALAAQIQKDFSLGILPANDSGIEGTTKYLSTDVSENYLALAQRIMSPVSVDAFEWVDI